MLNTLIFSDMDGTLIFSARLKRFGDVVCERKDGAEISCITAKQAELLPKLDIIPVTTRSIEQYKRIEIPNFSPRFALADNGGTLLINGETDGEWRESSLKYTRECEAALRSVRGAMERDPFRCFEIRLVDGLFLFTKSSEPEKSLAMLKNAANDSVSCFAVGEKLYALPKKLCKGELAKRLAERLPHGEIICAGDSPMDIPLLNIADIALFPDDIPAELVAAKTRITAPRERFPEFVIKTLWERTKNDIGLYRA